MSAAVLRSLDRERDRLIKRRVVLTARERRLREQLETKLRAVTADAHRIDEQIEKLDNAVKAVEAVLGTSREAAATRREAPAVLTDQERKTISVGNDGKPATDIERVRLALLLKGEMNSWQIASAAGVPSSSVHAHLTALMKRGEVVKVSRGRYRPAKAKPKVVA